MRILVVEDDHKVASFIQSGLAQEGYAVDVLHDGTMAGEQARAVDYDAVVLDLMLPGRSGFQVLRDIRAAKPSLPVLILTAKDALDDRIAGLDSGADDYMVKPFALAELSARLRAVLRRGAPRENDAPRGGSRNGHAGAAVHRGGPRDRTEAEGICAARVPDAQQRASGDRGSLIIEHVWDIHFDSVSNVVEVHINSLRNKIDRGFAVPLIQTVRGVGYCSEPITGAVTADGRLNLSGTVTERDFDAPDFTIATHSLRAWDTKLNGSDGMTGRWSEDFTSLVSCLGTAHIAHEFLTMTRVPR